MTEYVPPRPPRFDQDLLDKCKSSGDHRPLAFEWYKHVGLLTIQFVMAVPESPAFRTIPSIQFGVLIGSLNRCCRLMLANLRLASEGKHGEATRILDRCIFETCVKVVWLCQTTDADRFDRFLADGLKRDHEFKQIITDEIAKRGNGELVIERRMLDSIERSMTSAGLDEQAISKTKRLPDMASLLQATGKDRLAYVAIERMGSHAVHGSWTDLLTNYLEIDAGRFVPRDNDVSIDVNQFVAVALFVLEALESFIVFLAKDERYATELCTDVEVARKEILSVFDVAANGDFEPLMPPPVRS